MLQPVLIPRSWWDRLRPILLNYLLPALLSYCLLAYGIQAVRESILYPQPRAVTYVEFVRQRPQEGWYFVRGCLLDIPGSLYEKKSKARGTLFVPVLDAAHPDPSRVEVLLETEDDSIRSAFEEFLEAADTNKRDAFLRKNRDRLFRRDDFLGMVTQSPGFQSRLAFPEADERVMPNFIALRHERRPLALTSAIILVVLGSLATVGTLLLWVSFYLAWKRGEPGRGL